MRLMPYRNYGVASLKVSLFPRNYPRSTLIEIYYLWALEFLIYIINKFAFVMDSSIWESTPCLLPRSNENINQCSEGHAKVQSTHRIRRPLEVIRVHGESGEKSAFY